jgi:hypothetical protein
MPTQEELGGDGISLDLFEASLDEGVVRRTNNPAEQIQRMVITDRSPTSLYKVQVLLAACVHGHMDEEKTKPASLILVDYNLNATAEGAVFTSVGTCFEFSDYQPRDGTGGGNNVAKASPEVVAYAPFKEPKRFNESTVDQSKNTTPSAEFSPQFAGAGAGKIGYSSEKTVTHTQRCFDQGMAGRDYDGERPYRVWWSLTQNRSQNLGISPKLRLAMLVERMSYAKFQAVFKIAPRGGLGYTLDELKEKWLRRTTYDDPVIFDPQAPPMLGELEDELIAVEAVKREEDNSITAGVFGKLKKRERLEGLSYVWGLAAVETGTEKK